MALPSTLAFQPKLDAVNSTLFNQIATPLSGGTINPLDTVTIPIPGTGRYGAYLDPTQLSLSFQVKNNDGTNAMQLDGSAYSFIERVVVMSSGSVISDTQSFGALAALFLDMAPQSARTSGFSVLAGCEAAPTDANKNCDRVGATIAGNGTLNICMPLIGTAIDSTAIPDKLLPVGALSDLQIVLYMSSQKNAVYAGTSLTANWSLLNFRLVTNLIQLDETAQRMIDEQTGGAYKLSATLWKTFNYTTGATDASSSWVVPIKASSVKSLFSIWRDQANYNESYTKAWQTARDNPFGLLTGATQSSFYAQCGAQSIPQIGLRNPAEHYMSFQNAWHQLSVPSAFDNNFRYGDYDAAVSMSSAVPTGSFVTGINMESFSGKSGVLHAGTNITGGTALTLNAVYPTALSSARNITTFVCYDAIYEIAGGSIVCSW